MGQLTAAQYTDLFTRLGKLIKAANSYLTLQATVTADGDAACATFDGSSPARRDLINGMYSTFQGAANQPQGWIASCKAFCDTALADLQKDLNAPSSSPSAIIPMLILDMNDSTAPRSAAQTINASTVTAPSVAAAWTPVGTGTVIAGKTNEDNVDDQRAIDETVELVCTADQYSGASAGAEQFRLTGWPARSAYDGIRARGSGNGPTVTVCSSAGSTTELTDGGFEAWSGSPLAPTSWTVLTGTAATHIVRSATAYTGSYALSLVSDASIASISVAQAMTLSQRTVYAVGFRIRHIGATAPEAGSTLVVQVVGSSPTVSQTIYTIDPNTLTATYALKSGFFSLPAGVPADLQLRIVWTGQSGVTSGRGVIIDELVVVPAVELNSTWYAVVRGDADFRLNDAFRVTTANDYGGVIQTFFGRFYGVMLPSNAAGGETIADTLAT